MYRLFLARRHKEPVMMSSLATNSADIYEFWVYDTWSLPVDHPPLTIVLPLTKPVFLHLELLAVHDDGY